VGATLLGGTGTVDLDGNYDFNQSVSVLNGTILVLRGVWTNANNAGAITQSGGTIYLGGTFTVAKLNQAKFTGTGGGVNIFGTLNDPGATLNPDSRTWRVDG